MPPPPTKNAAPKRAMVGGAVKSKPPAPQNFHGSVEQKKGGEGANPPAPANSEPDVSEQIGADTIEQAEIREPIQESKEFNVKRFIKRHITVKLYEDAARTRPSTINFKYDAGELAALCARAKEAFIKQHTLVEVPAPCTIIGDIHGQFTDLLRIFYAVGWPHQQRMLFLGDYIDRGPNNLECVCLCMAYKVLYPKQVFLLRGNHEWRPVNTCYGFLEELNRRFNKVTGARLFNLFNTTFDYMPLAAVVGGRILAMHGGIGPSLRSWDDIRAIERPIATPLGLAQDLLWSDPDINNRVLGFGGNDVRGVSCTFGKKPIDELCKLLDVDLIVRAHQLVQDGYEFYGDKLVTVFSAPKYCNEFDNTAGILHVAADLSVSFTLLKPLLATKPRLSAASASGSGSNEKASTTARQTIGQAAAQSAADQHNEPTAVATSPIPPAALGKPATKESRSSGKTDKTDR